MKAICAAAALIILAAGFAHAQKRQVLKEDLFQYSAPAGWTVRKIPQSKFKIAHAPPDGEFAPNVNVVIEIARVNLDAYAKASVGQLKGAFPDIKILSNKPFNSGPGAKGRRLVMEFTHQGRNMRNILYLFEGKENRKYVVTASGLKQYGSLYDSAFDSAAKTFAVK
jgi:hypothetical protein